MDILRAEATSSESNQSLSCLPTENLVAKTSIEFGKELEILSSCRLLCLVCGRRSFADDDFSALTACMDFQSRLRLKILCSSL